ncbi:4-coumarate--CoA ligase 1-like [Chrysoperla carnea]|uniref:4-coumarate--CoA ligase 1-like n=1 Tax=Chrysoperla carnea TaxID=189513 RepID=UPI001D07E5C2|nr:4-coumarate--CoA ligase 1-like [Chrysoperla carnea]
MNAEENIICTGDVNFEMPKFGSYGEYILKETIKNGIQVLMIDSETEEVLTNQKLVQNVLQNIYVLQKLNLKAGDIICILSENRLEYFVPLIASLCLGITIATINPSLTDSELLHCMDVSKPKVVFSSAYSLKNLLSILNKCSYIQSIVCFDNISIPTNNVPVQYYSYKKLMEQTKNSMLNIRKFPFQQFNLKETIALIMYSSGTTGLPKGVMLTLHNLMYLHKTLNLPQYYLDDSTDVTISILPMYHSFGCIGHLNAFTKQITMVQLKKFDPERYFQLNEKYQATLCAVVPPICVLFAKSPLLNRYDLSSIKKIRCGAAPLSQSLEKQVTARLNLDFIRQGYGLTETTLVVTMYPKGMTLKSGSVGPPLIGVKAKVVDVTTGKALGPYEKGELCFKSDTCTKGYYNNPEATAEIIDSDGWLHTGDVGYYDSDYCFYIVDRIKQLIKVKGLQVAPAEIEAVLLQNPKIKDAGVIGVPDERSGELPLAFVVRQPNSNITELEVAKFVEDRLSPYKHLKGGIRFVNEIPKNPSGKILRNKLKDLLNDKSKL